METAIVIFGYLLLWAATDIGRKGDSKVKFMRGKWWAIFALLTAGGIVLNNVDRILNAL